ncbi:Low affinity potassium transport system protein kup [Thiorhodococcus drewsii AZ1]|uniref:Probable potassium transport system protein Kup n=1 Tax=Thiorhodococcus drewsii AZ1 TaxID=765913 RepID=G2DW63_9GAMM|nr:KUP/HAK/KT family potassium transporter [Thiorhodococcus drewsii]EGV33783.1 Low affinity potassium transport system protein kup [Thiorhodococcus drewsii AZ1]
MSLNVSQREPIGFSLVIAALGVVFGDIGTSPIYTMNILFGGAGLSVEVVNVLGVLSLIFWSLVLVVGVKYMLFVLSADNDGDGGVIALATLLRRRSHGRARSLALLLGVVASAMLIGDGLLTPAISVLSAVQGLELVAPELTDLVPELTVLVLIVLFAIQHRGTARVGTLFGPVMLAWFLVLGGTGIVWILKVPGVLAALDPRYAVWFFQDNGWIGFLTLGTVFLVVTGSEALYADLGHFGRRPIQMSWLFLVWPALMLNYLGQGALLLSAPEHPGNSFFGLVSGPWLIGLIGIATLATVIASQAIISGLFSLFRQLGELDYYPQLRVSHTSASQAGQIYIGSINWLLMAGTLLLVLGFRSADGLANAYGLAIGGVTLITSVLFLGVQRKIKRRGWLAILSLGVVFLGVDLAFLVALSTKLFSGAQIIVVISGGMLLIMLTWRWGQDRLRSGQQRTAPLLTDFVASEEAQSAARSPASAIFLTRTARHVPQSLLHNFRHNQMLHRETYVLKVEIEDAPRVKLEDKLTVERLGSGFFAAVLHLGYMERPRFETILDLLSQSAYPPSTEHPSLFLSRARVGIAKVGAASRWRARLYAFMQRNTPSPAFLLGAPPERLIEIGVHYEL